jgi:hypothetical protein
MSQIKNFTATVQSGIAGFLINVKGEVNCGMLAVMPSLTKKVPQGFNPKILLLDVLPASKDSNGDFQEAEYSENIHSQDTYTQVEFIDSEGNSIEIIPVEQAHAEASAGSKVTK